MVLVRMYWKRLLNFSNGTYFLEEIESNFEKEIPDEIEEYINKHIFNDFSVGAGF